VNKQKYKRPLLTVEEVLQKLRVYLPTLHDRYSVATLGIFGSYVRGEQRHASDLDFLVEFVQTPTLLQLATLQNDLSHLFDGKKIDLVLKRNLRPALSERILAEVIYP
jgi:hypothetical protein